MSGATTCSAASDRRHDVEAALDAHAVERRRRAARLRALPAPAPRPRRQPSIWVAPASIAATVLPTARPRLLWAWKPTAGTTARSASTRARASSRHHRAGGVDDVDAAGAVGGHQRRLLGERRRARACATSSGSRSPRGRARRRPRSAARRCRPRCSGSRSGPPGRRARRRPRGRAGCRRRAAAAPRSARAATALRGALDQLELGRSPTIPYCSEEPPSPSPWVTSISGTPPASSARDDRLRPARAS